MGVIFHIGILDKHLADSPLNGVSICKVPIINST